MGQFESGKANCPFGKSTVFRSLSGDDKGTLYKDTFPNRRGTLEKRMTVLPALTFVIPRRESDTERQLNFLGGSGMPMFIRQS